MSDSEYSPPTCSATGKRGWRHEDEHPLDTKPFLAVLRGPRGMRTQAVLQWDADGYLVQPSPNGPEMIGKNMVIEAWRPLPVYRPNAPADLPAVAGMVRRDVGLPVLREMKPSAKGCFPVRDQQSPSGNISSAATMAASLDSMPHDFFKPNAPADRPAKAGERSGI